MSLRAQSEDALGVPDLVLGRRCKAQMGGGSWERAILPANAQPPQGSLRGPSNEERPTGCLVPCPDDIRLAEQPQGHGSVAKTCALHFQSQDSATPKWCARGKGCCLWLLGMSPPSQWASVPWGVEGDRHPRPWPLECEALLGSYSLPRQCLSLASLPSIPLALARASEEAAQAQL